MCLPACFQVPAAYEDFEAQREQVITRKWKRQDSESADYSSIPSFLAVMKSPQGLYKAPCREEEEREKAASFSSPDVPPPTPSFRICAAAVLTAPALQCLQGSDWGGFVFPRHWAVSGLELS
ncbi:small integral membrane protein 17 isoform X2 [Mastomys coucha]|uniref:small integral membrane protein 17 isoform X2 n=1 Tax=Mastomys coucha TaxID=35658 RepID=UPI0012620863|nr:small integral membrane protein 17 isoform X2 [Mastomys coucha]